MGKLPFEKIKREIFIKKKSEPGKYGGIKKNVEQLLESSIVIIDKPAGPTSHQVSYYLKKILKLKKAGHSGTLDPGVTGVLPVAIGRGTRIVQSLLTSGKEYVCLMHIHDDYSEKEIEEVLKSFVGKIKQLPPIKSAVKRQWRFRKIYYIDVLEIKGRDVLFKVGCQAGTYIRKLCHDIGIKLGCGAHMAELRRTKVGPFNESNITTLQELADAYYYYKKGNDKLLKKILLPIESGVKHLPKIWVLDTAVNPLAHGVQLKVPGVVKVESEIQVDDPVAVMTLKDELILVGRARMISKDIIKNSKGIVVKTEQVFIDPDIYPKIE